jgi:hypothetical protein
LPLVSWRVNIEKVSETAQKDLFYTLMIRVSHGIAVNIAIRSRIIETSGKFIDIFAVESPRDMCRIHPSYALNAAASNLSKSGVPTPPAISILAIVSDRVGNTH